MKSNSNILRQVFIGPKDFFSLSKRWFQLFDQLITKKSKQYQFVLNETNKNSQAQECVVFLLEKEKEKRALILKNPYFNNSVESQNSERYSNHVRYFLWAAFDKIYIEKVLLVVRSICRSNTTTTAHSLLPKQENSYRHDDRNKKIR